MYFSSNKKFWFLVCTYLTLTISDMILTYVDKPKLPYETYLFASVMSGLGWSTLIIGWIFINTLISVVYVLLVYYSFVKYQRLIIECEGIKQYVSMLMFDRPDKFSWIWWKFPPNKATLMRAIAPIGFGIAYSLIIFQALCVVEWIGIIYESRIIYWYFQNINIFPPLVSVIVMVLSFLIFYTYWFYKEYKINQQS